MSSFAVFSLWLFNKQKLFYTVIVAVEDFTQSTPSVLTTKTRFLVNPASTVVRISFNHIQSTTLLKRQSWLVVTISISQALPMYRTKS